MPLKQLQIFAVMTVASLTPVLSAQDEKWKTTYAPEPPIAQLVITENVYDGNSDFIAEYHRGGTFVRCKVGYGHNPPTKEQGYSGNFHAIYLVVAGKSHPDPKTLGDRASLLKAFKALPITIEEKRKTEKPPVTTVWQYEIKFGKAGPKVIK